MWIHIYVFFTHMGKPIGISIHRAFYLTSLAKSGSQTVNNDWQPDQAESTSLNELSVRKKKLKTEMTAYVQENKSKHTRGFKWTLFNVYKTKQCTILGHNVAFKFNTATDRRTDMKNDDGMVHGRFFQTPSLRGRKHFNSYLQQWHSAKCLIFSGLIYLCRGNICR